VGVLQLVCAVLAAGFDRAEPSVLPYTLVQEYPVIQVRRSDGKVEKYLLSMSASVNIRFSDLSSEHGTTENRLLEIGNSKQQPYAFRVGPNLISDPSVQGVIGVDFFRNQTVGFDFESRRLFLWEAKTESAKVNDWGRALQKWGYIGRPSYELTELPLDTVGNSLPTLKVSFRGTPALALLASSMSGNALTQGLTGKSGLPDTASNLLLSRSVGHPAWNPGVLEFETGRNLHQSGVPTLVDLRLAIGALNSKLAVMDLRGKKLWVEKLPRHAADSLLLSRLLGINVYIENGHLKLGSVSPLSSASNYEGSLIKFIGKVSSEALLGPLRSNKETDLVKLLNAIRATEHAEDLLLKYPGGEAKIPLRTVKG